MKTKRNRGFTLIELLVVITIIAILASFAVPVFSKVIASAQQTKQVNNAKQILIACAAFAADYGGSYPAGTFDKASGRNTGEDATTAEGCFQDLIDSKKLDVEKIFWSPQHGATGDGSWCAKIPPNEDVDIEGSLKGTENCWDYMPGMGNSSRGAYPLIWEASDGGAGDKWTSVTAETPGNHPWDNAVIFGFVDGSASKETIGTTGEVKTADGSESLTADVKEIFGTPAGCSK